jgi:hypothetical protein
LIKECNSPYSRLSYPYDEDSEIFDCRNSSLIISRIIPLGPRSLYLREYEPAFVEIAQRKGIIHAMKKQMLRNVKTRVAHQYASLTSKRDINARFALFIEFLALRC